MAIANCESKKEKEFKEEVIEKEVTVNTEDVGGRISHTEELPRSGKKKVRKVRKMLEAERGVRGEGGRKID